MDEASKPVSSSVISVSENKIKKTFKLFKDSWRSFSKAQKFQLIAVFALVLGLPTLLGGVYVAKIYRSGAATPPVTPPYSSPTPAPLCNVACNTDRDCSPGLVCYLIGGVTLENVVVAGYCRNPQCTTSTNCTCSTPPPPPTQTPIPTPIVCRQATQTVSLTPKSQSGYQGNSLRYDIVVTNNNVGCSTTEFTLTAQTPYTDWASALSNTILSLGPGATGTAQVIFTSSKTSKLGSFPVGVSASSSTSTVQATSAYTVLGTPTPIPSPKPTPILKPTPTPTPIITCKTGVNSFAVSTPCTGGYRYVTFACYDGFSQKAGGPTSCKSSATWSTYAATLCKGHSNCPASPTPISTIVPTPIPTPTPCRVSLFGFCLIH